MFKKLRGLFSNDLSIDLGTANTLIFVKEKGIILDEPSVVAIRTINGRRTVVAVGTEAKKMLGRTPGNITAIRPLKDGVIADFQVTEEMLKHFVQRVHEDRYIKPSPRILVAVPCKSTQVERRAIRESVLKAGAREVRLIEEPMAAAIGAGLPVEEASGSMVVDIGGGTSEVAILALNGIVYANSLKVGGDRLDESLISYIRRNQGVLIGDATAEKIKHNIGTASPDSEVTEMEVRGRNLAEGIPITFQMNSKQAYDAMLEPLSAIVQAIRTALEQSPPELSADISERGIVLTGGGAMLRDLDVLISNQTGIPVLVAEEPLTCVAKGGGSALEIMDRYDIDLLSTE
ncbi:MAG TPA: rod shape-determining protein [Gammaproteobacteria bacterium]|nr:rod shape-determining protein [Gammaproteobacteria bacterium]